jgi:hypothetical protein
VKVTRSGCLKTVLYLSIEFDKFRHLIFAIEPTYNHIVVDHLQAAAVMIEASISIAGPMPHVGFSRRGHSSSLQLRAIYALSCV